MSLGGSTNAIVHLVAMARRAGVALDLDHFDRISRRTPVLGDIRPSGRFLMEDFFYAGGLRALMARLADLLDLTAPDRERRGHSARGSMNAEGLQRRGHSAAGKRAFAARAASRCCAATWRRRGAVIKQTAADPSLLVHAGPAVVFRNYNDLAARIDDPALPVTQGLGARAAAGGAAGWTGHARVGDAADSAEAVEGGRARHGAHLGCADERHRIRHVRAPRGARIVRRRAAGARPRWRRRSRSTCRRADCRSRSATTSSQRRRQNWTPPAVQYPRGYGLLHAQHVLQADEGCDFDFLRDGPPVPEPEIH